MRTKPSELSLCQACQLQPGQFARPAAIRSHFGIGVAIRGYNGTLSIVALDGEHAFHFWSIADAESYYVPIAMPDDLILQLDESSEKFEDWSAPGSLTILPDAAMLTLVHKPMGFAEAVYLRLSDWTLGEIRVHDGAYASYRSWAMGTVDDLGQFSAVYEKARPCAA